MITNNTYCSCCLKTQPFRQVEQGLECPVCRKRLVLLEDLRDAVLDDDSWVPGRSPERRTTHL